MLIQPVFAETHEHSVCSRRASLAAVEWALAGDLEQARISHDLIDTRAGLICVLAQLVSQLRTYTKKKLNGFIRY